MDTVGRKPTEFHGHRRGSRMHCRETRKEEKGVYWGSDEAKAFFEGAQK